MTRVAATTAVALLLAVTACGGGRGGKTRIDRVTADGAVLTVHFLRGADACHAGQQVTVDERRDEVRLTAWVKGTGGTCPAVGVRTSERVTLDAPLGARALLDASTGERIEPTAVD